MTTNLVKIPSYREHGSIACHHSEVPLKACVSHHKNIAAIKKMKYDQNSGQNHTHTHKKCKDSHTSLTMLFRAVSLSGCVQSTGKALYNKQSQSESSVL